MSASAVRSVSEAVAGGDTLEIGKTKAVVRRMAWVSGLIGTILTFSFSNYLSLITFGNAEFSVAFRWLSITLLFTQLSNSQLVVLQGFRKLAFLAKANVFGNALGLICSLPMYFFLGKDGIVGSLLISSSLSLLVALYYGRKESIVPGQLTMEQFSKKAKHILGMGIALSFSNILVLLGAYFFKIYIGSKGGISDVGLYSAGYAIVNTYVGMIFTAMATDFYPRLSGTKEEQSFNSIVNHQGEIAILIVGPLLIGMIVFIKYLILLLFSSEFLQIIEMIKWCLLGILFKAVSWPIGFIILAKGESKVFFLSELVANINMLVLGCIGYYFFSLEGIGISYLIGYFLLAIQISIIVKNRYNFRYNYSMIRIFIVMFLMLVLVLVVPKFIPAPADFVVSLMILAISISVSLRLINNRFSFIDLITSKIFSNRRK